MQYYHNPYMPYQGQSFHAAAQPMPRPMPVQDIDINKALEMIKNAVAGEREDELFYDYLISVAPCEEDKQIIRSIRDDERKHNKMFRQIYFELTGQMLPPSQDETFEKPASYIDGIRRALFGELGAVERYRQILFNLNNTVQKHVVRDNNR